MHKKQKTLPVDRVSQTMSSLGNVEPCLKEFIYLNISPTSQVLTAARAGEGTSDKNKVCHDPLGILGMYVLAVTMTGFVHLG